jgi:dTDP-4-dehydrorhamnose 3,5-epimerase
MLPFGYSNLNDMQDIFQVVKVPLKKVINDRGHLMEVQRIDDVHFAGFGQVYITNTLPSVVKAWYRHHHQLDQLALVAGQVVLMLWDSRPSSPTFHTLQKIEISDVNPMLIQIPTGVWHGFKAIGNNAACLIHINTVPYDAENPDEDRLAPDSTLIPFSWDEI